METKVLDSCAMIEQAKTVYIMSNQTSTVIVILQNKKNLGLFIKKMNAVTKVPLANAIFKVKNSKGKTVG